MGCMSIRLHCFLAPVRLGSGLGGGADVGRGVDRAAGDNLHRQRLQHRHHLRQIN